MPTRFFIKLLRKTGLTNKFYHILNSVYTPFHGLHPFNQLALVKSFQKAKEENTVGDYYEFGVSLGFSLWFAYQLGKEHFLNEGEDIHFWGFDSFEGFPTPGDVDKSTSYRGTYFVKGSFAASLDLVKGNLEKHNADMQKITLIKGFYEDILNDALFEKYNFKKASVVLIDCDMYKSTVPVLKFITKFLVKGTIILFDDYYITDDTAGQQLAIKEWLSLNKNIRLKEFCEYGVLKGFIVNEI